MMILAFSLPGQTTLEQQKLSSLPASGLDCGEQVAWADLLHS